jgi:hypothetical protein
MRQRSTFRRAAARANPIPAPRGARCFHHHLAIAPAYSISATRKEFEMSAKGLVLAAAVAILGFSLAGCVDGGPYYGAYTYSDYYGPYPGYYGGVVYSGGYYSGGYYRHHRRHWRHGSGHHWQGGSRHNWRGGHHSNRSTSYNRSGSRATYQGGSHHGRNYKHRQ